MVGTGRQAFTQVAAIAVVRALTEVLVAGRDAERATAFADRVRSSLGVEARVVRSVAEGARQAAIVTTITNAREPILDAAMLPPSVHVNAVGAVAPNTREVGTSVFAGANLVVCDSVEQARQESSELEVAVADGSLRWDDVVEPSDVVTGLRSVDRGARTVFKSLGVGLEDVAVAALVWRRARERA